MHTIWIALVVVCMIGIGIYFAISDLSQQYALDTSGSLASGATCATDKATVRPNQTATFRLFGIPTGTAIAWSAPEGTGRVLTDGSFAVAFVTTGSKSVSAFLQNGNHWYRIPCPVSVQ